MEKSRKKDFLYQNAPLVEVITEVRWKLNEVTSAGAGIALDPHRDEFLKSLLEKAKEIDLSFEERLIPREVPSELVPHVVMSRFRKGENEWPLIQAGAGIFAANVVKPYEGWNSYKKFLKSVLRVAHDAYPAAGEVLIPVQLELKYINGFDESFAYEQFMQFINDNLNVELSIPVGFLKMYLSDASKIAGSVDLKFPLTKPADSALLIKIGSAKVAGKEGVVVQLSVRRSGELESKGLISKELLTWMDDAHAVARKAFFELTRSELKERMMPTDLSGD